MHHPRDTDRSGLWEAARQLAIGTAVGIVVFGLPFAAFWTVADSQLGLELDDEDGVFEWIGAGMFLVAAIFQAVAFWRSDVPGPQRLIRSMRRNPFHLGLAVVLFIGFAEEISWGQRIFGWATPADMLLENMQGETNIHNLAPFHGDSLLNVHRLFNLFWFSYGVLVPVTAAVVPALSVLYRRIALPVPPIWVGGLFVGAFLAWRLYHALEPARALAPGQEIAESAMAVCFAVLGIAQLRRIDDGRGRSEPSPTALVRSA